MSRYTAQQDLDEAIAELKTISGDEVLGRLKMSFYIAKEMQRTMNFEKYGDEMEYSKLCENEALDRMNDRFYNIRKEML